MGILIVTGSGENSGQTVVTAAVAALARADGRDPAVVKLAETGVAPGRPGGLAEITRLSGVTDAHEFARYSDRLAPHHAARVSGLPELVFADVVHRVIDLDATHDLVVVDAGAGVLVPFDNLDRWTLIDLAGALSAEFVVVAKAAPTGLDHAALTVDLIEQQGAARPHLVIGRWPAEPYYAERCTLEDLQRLGRSGALGGVLPDGLATMRGFGKQVRTALAPALGGTFDSWTFVSRSMA